MTAALDQARAEARGRLRRQHLASSLHRLGARPLFEFIDEIARHHGIGGDLDKRLERYARLDREVLHLVGGDRFVRKPLRVIAGGRR
jgi:hypothetical protein